MGNSAEKFSINVLEGHIATSTTWEAKPKEKRVLRVPQKPDTSLLTEDQLKAYNEMQEWYKGDKTKPFHLLQGYAGTGKTFLVSMFVEDIIYSGSQVVMTAPTNKAVKVLADAGSLVGVSYCTIHSLLGLKENIDGFGNQTFIQKFKDQSISLDYDLIVVDEVSMLNDDLLVGAERITGLFEYAKMFGFKILFVGDPCQIPPVGSADPIPLTESSRQHHKIGVSRLTEIVRQAKGNPIIDLTLDVRQALGRAIAIPLREDKFIQTEDVLTGVFYLDSSNKELFYSLLKAHFCSKAFETDANFVKIIAYTNKTVKVFNNLIRQFIYGKGIDKICLGEKLIANKPIVSGEDESVVLYTTNDEFEVIDFEVVDGKYQGAEIRYYEVRTQAPDKPIKVIKVIHEDSEEDYELILKHLKSLALEQKKGSWEAAAKWKDFYAIQTFFADVNYNYAITAHKSQGSTYKTAFVLEADMDCNRNIVERNRIKYTAFTRPSEKLFIIE